MFFSDAKQDRFVANMLNFQDKGFYLDIGSADSCSNNNTFYFDSLGWEGICIEYNPIYNRGYLKRKGCNFFNKDATTFNYSTALMKLNPKNVIDYISLDIDEMSYYVLKLLPLDKFRFKIMTIEHDFYRFGDKYRSEQRKYLTDNGYFLICSDVCVQQPDFKSERCSFEDWWINTDFFEKSLINQIKSEWCYPSQIISKFNQRDNWYE